MDQQPEEQHGWTELELWSWQVGGRPGLGYTGLITLLDSQVCYHTLSNTTGNMLQHAL